MSTLDLALCQDALRAAFPPGSEQYRVGPTWERDGVKHTRPLAYIDARAVFDRLDEAAGPGNWSTDLERLGPGTYLCRLTVLGVTRADVGMAGDNESEKEKGGASDAVKRAAVQFGVGRYLYDLEMPIVALERKGNDWVLPYGWRPPGRSAAPSPAPSANTVPFSTGQPKPATDKQIAKIGSEMSRAGWSEQEGREHLMRAFGKQSRRDLTSQEASTFIDTLIALPGTPRAL